MLFESGTIYVFFAIASHKLPPICSLVEMLRKVHFTQAFCHHGMLLIDNFCNKQYSSLILSCRIHQHNISLPLVLLNWQFKLENVGHLRILILHEQWNWSYWADVDPIEDICWSRMNGMTMINQSVWCANVIVVTIHFFFFVHFYLCQRLCLPIFMKIKQ